MVGGHGAGRCLDGGGRVCVRVPSVCKCVAWRLRGRELLLCPEVLCGATGGCSWACTGGRVLQPPECCWLAAAERTHLKSGHTLCCAFARHAGMTWRLAAVAAGLWGWPRRCSRGQGEAGQGREQCSCWGAGQALGGSQQQWQGVCVPQRPDSRITSDGGAAGAGRRGAVPAGLKSGWAGWWRAAVQCCSAWCVERETCVRFSGTPVVHWLGCLGGAGGLSVRR